MITGVLFHCVGIPIKVLMPSTLPRKSVRGLLIKNVGKGNLTKYSVARLLDFSLGLGNQENFLFL